MRRFAGLRSRLGVENAPLCAFHRGRKRCEISESFGLLRELELFGPDVADVLIKPREAVAMAAHAGLELVAPGGQVSKCRGEFGKHALGTGKRRLGRRDALV